MKLLATDVDGTLLRPDGTITPRVTASLAALDDAGITAVLVTARSWRSLAPIVRGAVPHGLAICSNGAVVYDLDRETVIRTLPFDVDAVRAFANRACDATGATIAWETATDSFRTQAFHKVHGFPPEATPEWIAGIEFMEAIPDDHAVTKFFLRHHELGPDELLAAVAPVADGFSVTISGGPFVEVMAPGITKASTLAMLCAELGIDAADVVAVGDHTNDIPMLQWAGRGVAMANAHASVLEVIAERTASVDDDGLALVAESLLSH